ncbi:hypothetical protein HR059_09125 [Sinorhizobium meliloti WSM1022]|jgi:hypothetical protein|uniref:Lipoprotein n=3 Tax=Rhizobium meliloti TaxID=382 RepID=A0AAW9TK28_RHIML|nr:membrane protein [Sinorhizobium meliloti]PST25932.1 hypothetical protein C7U62_15040 [Mesorhizobium loti]TWB00606.1 hypothetical protein FB000_109156 [Ensifer sp. SEMIA 134]TWB35654.1 hypothetical protein FB001_108157 [Ensifer sp. SEMIA 135]AEG04704.1 lipoprotein transmembrane [Sinorhizobium meliloti BL225C]AEG53678.1 lipoprotein transmembrane [Sinorhizobium meliloti AK83]
MTGRSSIVAAALALLTMAGCMSSQSARNSNSPQQSGGSGEGAGSGSMGGSGGGSSGY